MRIFGKSFIRQLIITDVNMDLKNATLDRLKMNSKKRKADQR